MKDAVIIGVTALICMTIVIVVGLGMGHDSALLAGGLASLGSVAGAFGAYKASEARYPKWHNDRLTKERDHETHPPTT